MTRQFGWDGFAFGFGPRGFWSGPGGRGRRRQWFESGDMKYVILKLLKDKPRHGYEVMKELEERLHGCYSPSPGTVYPTLQWLEDEGLVRAKEVDGKKVYEVTDAGSRFLEPEPSTPRCNGSRTKGWCARRRSTARKCTKSPTREAAFSKSTATWWTTFSSGCETPWIVRWAVAWST